MHKCVNIGKLCLGVPLFITNFIIINFQSGHHEAALFEHVAKMGRILDKPQRNTAAVPPVRFRSAVAPTPLTDLSSMPPIVKSPISESIFSDTDSDKPRSKVSRDESRPRSAYVRKLN